MPAGTLTYAGTNILADGELFASVLADGKALLPTNGDVLLYQPEISPIRFGEIYGKTDNGLIFHEDGSVTALFSGGVTQQYPAGTLTYDGPNILMGETVFSAIYDGSIIFSETGVSALESSLTPIKFGESYVGKFDGTYAGMYLYEDGSVKVIIDGSTQQMPAGTLTYNGANIFMGGEMFAAVSADGNVLISVNGDILVYKPSQPSPIKFGESYVGNNHRASYGSYSDWIFYEDGSAMLFMSGTDGGTIQLPVGTITYDGPNILLSVDGVTSDAATTIQNGNVIIMQGGISSDNLGEVLLLQSQTSPIKFGETYVGNFEGQSAEVIFYENGSVTLDANGSIQQLPAGTVTYDGLLGLGQYGDLLISTTNDGSIVYFLPNGKFGEHCIVSLETSSTSIKFGETYVGNFEGTYTEMILFEDGSVTLDANGYTQQYPVGTLTYDGVNILMGGEDFAVVSADGNILMSLNGDMLALYD